MSDIAHTAPSPTLLPLPPAGFGRALELRRGCARTFASRAAPAWWLQRRDAACNWIALGLLLAAWNSCDNDAAARAARPSPLRGYGAVSVRAVERAGGRAGDASSIP